MDEKERFPVSHDYMEWVEEEITSLRREVFHLKKVIRDMEAQRSQTYSSNSLRTDIDYTTSPREVEQQHNRLIEQLEKLRKRNK